MNVRTTKPENGNKFYNTVSNGGYSWCIVGSPVDKGCNVLANCVGYVCGRFNEIIGEMKYPQLNCNAENFINRNKEYNLGLEVSDAPTIGGIMVFKKGSTYSGSDGAGHVMIVEKILERDANGNPTKIYTSESAYNGSAFYNCTRANSNGRWGMSSSYHYEGCLVNPAVVPSPQPKFNIGDKVIISGNLYKSAYDNKPSGHVDYKETYITRIIKDAPHPYNTTNDLGWMDEKDIKPYEVDYKELYEKELLINKDLKLQVEHLNEKIQKAMEDLK